MAEESYEDSWGPTLAVMLSAHQRTIRAALPFLRQSEHPRIVNVASTEGLGASPGNSPYAAAKHGVIGLTRGLAVDLGKDAITVNCILPRPDPHRDHRRDPRGAQDHLRQASRAAAPLRDPVRRWRT